MCAVLMGERTWVFSVSDHVDGAMDVMEPIGSADGCHGIRRRAARCRGRKCGRANCDRNFVSVSAVESG